MLNFHIYTYTQFFATKQKNSSRFFTKQRTIEIMGLLAVRNVWYSQYRTRYPANQSRYPRYESYND
jgi:hypothetical protein